MVFKKGVKRAEMSNVIDVYVNGTVGQVRPRKDKRSFETCAHSCVNSDMP